MPTMPTVDTRKLTEMPHLTDDTEDLKKQAAAAVDLAAKSPLEANDPKLQEEYSFLLDWTDPVGRRWVGDFTNKILTVQQLQAVGVMRARLGGGLPASAIDDLTAELNLMISHLEFSLAQRPDWAKDLRSIKDTRVLYRIYEEVASHEATFFGWGKGSGEAAAR